MLRQLLKFLLLVMLAAPIGAIEANAADPPAASGITGLFVTTRYPALTVRAGETTTIDLSVRNFKLPPQLLTLGVPEVAAGWKATILGGGQPVTAVEVAPDAEERLQLRLEPPAAIGHGDYRFTVEAKNAQHDEKLPVTLTIGEEVPAKLKLTTNFPALRGTPTTSFKYRVTVNNDSGRDATVNLSADAPKNFLVNFTEAFGSQQITSLPIEAGKSKDVEASLTLPRDTQAGEYKLALHAKTEAAGADLPVSLTIVGQPRLAVSGEGGRLSGEAYAGQNSQLTVTLRNDGSEAARCRAVGDDARRVEIGVRPEATAAARGRRDAERQGHLDPVRPRHRRRLPDDDPRQRRGRALRIGQFPHHGADLDPVGRGGDRHHRNRAARRRFCRRPLRPPLGPFRWPMTW
jgi:hypothetical protein